MSLSMQTMKACNSYHGVLEGRALHRCADGRSAFKVYFMSIIGRSEPAKFVWGESGMTPGKFLTGLDALEGAQGVGFITAFPHIAKIFRFGPEAETVANVRAFNPRQMTPLDLTRCEGYVEFGCYAEAAIGADEFTFWAQAESVEEYLERWSKQEDWPIQRHGKLLDYWNMRAK